MVSRRVTPYVPNPDRPAPEQGVLNRRERGNRADAVYGPAKIAERVDRLGQASRNPFNRALLDRGTLLGRMLRVMLGEVLAYVPVITGRLYRSFRMRLHAAGVTLFFQAPYAIYVEFKSRKNRGYFRRGLQSGIRKANRMAQAEERQSGIRITFTGGRILRRGQGGAIAEVTYQYAAA